MGCRGYNAGIGGQHKHRLNLCKLVGRIIPYWVKLMLLILQFRELHLSLQLKARQHAGNAREEADVSNGLGGGRATEDEILEEHVHTNDWAHKRGPLGCRLEALPGDAQLGQVRGQAVKACAAGLASGLHFTYFLGMREMDGA